MLHALPAALGPLGGARWALGGLAGCLEATCSLPPSVAGCLQLRHRACAAGLCLQSWTFGPCCYLWATTSILLRPAPPCPALPRTSLPRRLGQFSFYRLVPRPPSCSDEKYTSPPETVSALRPAPPRPAPPCCAGWASSPSTASCPATPTHIRSATRLCSWRASPRPWPSTSSPRWPCPARRISRGR